MTFQQLYQEVQALRADSSAGALPQIKNAVNSAEIDVWNAADWDFKRMPAASMTVTAGVGTLPADFGAAYRVYDPRGYELTYLRPDDFEALYIAPVPLPSGNAEAYTVIGGTKLLAGPPETGTFKLAYRRRYAHFASGSVVTAGLMSVDTDFPIWDTEHHYLLVPFALAALGRMTNELDAEAYQGEGDRLLAKMKSDLTGGAVEKLIRVWGESGQMQGASSPDIYGGWGY